MSILLEPRPVCQPMTFLLDGEAHSHRESSALPVSQTLDENFKGHAGFCTETPFAQKPSASCTFSNCFFFRTKASWAKKMETETAQ